MFDYFPRLKERRNTKAGSLSGGEQQMLTICRSLLGNPLVMLIDEPTEGPGAQDRRAVGECIADMPARRLGGAGRTEAGDRAEGLHPRLRDGPRPDRLRRHAAQLAGDEALLAEWLAV
jgi:branched-chain amino acid transport system ATP-binding protein